MLAPVRSPVFHAEPDTGTTIPPARAADTGADYHRPMERCRRRRAGRPPRPQRLQPHHLAAIDSYIARHIESVLRIDDLAAQVGLSRYHFLRCFKRATGSSPLQYVLARRVEHARRLLSQSEESIAAVAYAAGFSSQSHLNAMFKRHFGVTPGAFVRVHRRLAGTPEPALVLPSPPPFDWRTR